MRKIIRLMTMGLAAILIQNAWSAEQRTVTGKPMLSSPGTVTQAEALLSRAKVRAGPIDVQDMHGFGPQWGGGAQLLWRPPAPVDKPIRDWPFLQLPLEVAQAGLYDVTLYLTGAPDYGRVRVFLRGQPVGDYAGYAPGVSLRSFNLGPQKLVAGSNPLMLVVFGKEDASGNFFVGIDRIAVNPVTPK
jgi:hypothetical protein